jgi:hypothetical protein
MVNQMTGTASLDIGALAETWTASELRPLRRNGWRIANHLLLRFGDIDHLLVDPNGVLIIETKWSAYEWAPGTDRFQQAIRQVKGRAHPRCGALSGCDGGIRIRGPEGRARLLPVRHEVRRAAERRPARLRLPG